MDVDEETTTIQKIDNKKKRVYWTPEKDILLLKLVGDNWENLNWKDLTIDFDMSYKQCYDRYININPLVNKGIWTAFEEQKLKDLMEIYGEKWALISREFGGTRSGKQIRHHFKIIPVLTDLNINKTHFSKEEDTKICQLYQIHGPKWEYISTFFDNRSGDHLKNRYYNKRNQNKLKVIFEAEEIQRKLLLSQIIIKFEKPCIIIAKDDVLIPIFTDVIEVEVNVDDEEVDGDVDVPFFDYFEHKSERSVNGEFFNDISLDNIFENKVFFDHSSGNIANLT